jgi:hypothetical protein
MYFIDPHAEMRLYKLEQERLARRLELLRALETGSADANPVAQLARSLATIARRVRGGSVQVTPEPTPLSQHRDEAVACADELAA